MSDIGKTALKRIASAVVALPVYVFCFATDILYSIPILLASLLISLVCLYEYYQIAYRDEDQKPFLAFGLTAAAAINIIMYLYGFGGLKFVRNFDARAIFVVVIILIASILVYQVFKRPIRGAIYSLAVTAFGVLYLAFFFSHIILMKALSNGFYYILMLNLVIMLNDSAAYFGGVLFGRHRTGFPVSPNKSWEGYFFGLLVSVLTMVITNQVYQSFCGIALFSIIESAIVGIILSILGHTGDLVESAFKRDSAIKDSGSIIPGHGGMWDVFDALIFSLPFFYYYLVFKGVV